MSARYADFVERHFVVKEKLRGNEWLILCPFHDNKQTPSCCVNVQRGKFICYSCDEKGDIEKLRAKVGGSLTQVFDLSSVKQRRRAIQRELWTSNEKVRRYPDSWLDQFQPLDSDERDRAWARRKINPSTVDEYYLGYAPFTMKDLNVMTLVVPIRDVRGNVLGVVRRVQDSDYTGSQRYFYPYGFKISEHLFNAHDAHEKGGDTLVLTEGSIDAMLVSQRGYVCAALLGATLHAHQLTILQSVPQSQIVLLLDWDEAGRKSTEACIPLLVQRGFDVYVARRPKGVRAKDPGELSGSQIDHVIEHAQSWVDIRRRRITM